MEKATAHYVFHCPKGSVAEKEINEIVELQEGCYSFISDFLCTDAKGKIHYHFFDTSKEVGSQYALVYDNNNDEPCNGFALPDTRSKDGFNHIFAVYNNEVKCVGFHEDAHIISYSLGRPVSQFIREGLAMFFDRYWWGIDNYSWTRWYVEERKMPSVTELLENEKFNEYSEAITYPVSGAFTGYLIERFGKDKYVEFYKCIADKGMNAFKQIFRTSMSSLEKDFIKYIKLFKLREEIRKMLMEDINE
ncbi:MAG: hypothetical protein KBT35_06740 [Firmicutes bacterium]|nr:hypothetical protein [Candidatus Colivicinus equi]